jgi:dihydrolipoamide dehydrogenase
MVEQTRIVIIGGGPGGYEAALVAADNGADVTVVCNEGLGGNSVLWDCVPSKAMIVSAEAMGWLQSAHRLGVRDAGHAQIGSDAVIDMDAVMSRVQALAEEQSADITRKVEKSGVRYVQGVGRLAGREAVEVDTGEGRTSVLPADIVLIATGSRPRILPFSKPDAERVFTSRELFSLRELPERLIVVGSGATGAEYAHAFARFGSEVHLISSREQVLPGEDPDAAAVIEDSFERWGAVIHRQRRATDLERSADGVRVKVAPSSGGQVAPGQEEWVEGTHVLFCIGQVPYTQRLGLESAGVALQEDGSIPVDGVSRTNVRTIYAAGDITGRMMLASVAAMQGRNAMWHALGQAVSPIRWDAVAACIFTSPEVASVGVTPQDGDGRVPMNTVQLPLRGNPRAKMAEHTDGFVKIHSMQGSGTVLGGTVVSAGASDLIMPVTVAVNSRLTVMQLAHTFSIYPSMSGSLQETARLLMGEPVS